MSTMYQEYRDRVFSKGTTKTKRDYVNKKVRESIDSLIQNSQYGFTITVNDQEHDVAILSTSSTQDYEKANIIAHNEVGLDRGSLFKWNNEYWIILQKMFRPEQPGFNGYAYRCTGELKWIDKNGKLWVRPGYISSGRTTNSLTYTPDVNYKFDNVFMHDTDWSMIAAVQQDLTLHNEMRFIIKGHAYRVTNIDNVSIDNVSILSMVDDKLKDSDLVYDENNNYVGIADFKKYEYALRTDLKEYNLFAGDVQELGVTVTHSGIVVDEELVYTSLDPNVLEIDGNKVIGRGIGQTQIICSLAKNPEIKMIIDVNVQDTHPEEVEIIPYIEGPDYILWNDKATFTLSGANGTFLEPEWHTAVKHDPVIINENSITLSIKDKYAGTITVRCQVEGYEEPIEKDVLIKTTIGGSYDYK